MYARCALSTAGIDPKVYWGILGPYILLEEYETSNLNLEPRDNLTMSEDTAWSHARRISSRVEPPEFPDREFDITDYGGVGDDQTDCTEAFKRAITACNEAGGGRVVVPEGTYRTGAIHLEEDVNLHVTTDATIAFSRDPADYLPVVYTRWEGTELYNYSPFIYAFERTNIAITGSGTLDGRANDDNWWPWSGSGNYGWKPGTPDQDDDQDDLEQMAADGVPVEDRVFGEGHYLRPNFVQPYRCENVLIEDVTVKGSPMWMLHPVLCENVTVQNVTLDSHGINNDGCNPESCTNVVIRGCEFDVGDDCIAIKSGREADGRRVDVPSRNIVIEECTLTNLYGAITIGSEMSGGVRNVFVRECSGGSSDLYFGLYIKTNACRGGFAEDIFLKDLSISNLNKEVVSCDFHRGEGDTGSYTPRVRNVELRNVTVDDTRGLFFVRGFDRAPIRDFRVVDCAFENVDQLAKIENADITFSGTEVNGIRCDSEDDLRELFS